LEALVDEGALQADEQWKRLRARLSSGTLADAEVPEELRATLRDYQRTGFLWLARLASLESGAVLADDMGLGKTVQALALLVHRASEGPALVIAPTSLGDNWAREAERFAPSLRVRVHRGGGRHAALESDPPGPGDVLVASYDVVALDVDALSSIQLATLVLDEAQSVKNPEALRTKAVRELRARVRIALTGTPLENRLSELWSIVSIVHPGLLGPWEHFRARFAQPIERDHDAERLAALAALVRPYLLRRTKEVVTPELPPRIEILREVELSDAERRLYDAERASAIAALGEAGEAQRFRVLASITRLREIACDASLVVPDAGVTSSKLAALIDLVDELEGAGRKVLVFSQFVRLLERVAILLRARNTSYLQLDGSTPAAERARRVERFQAGEATVFLLSLKAGGTGLNLTTADTVVHLDPWWNPAVEDQASDRAHRIGQDKPVTIVRLVAKDTIEQAVLALHDAKRALTRGVLEGADAAGALSAVDLLDLIRTAPTR
nr:DEAD/DEAH box helicase [Myxococcota bacterium]